MALTRIGSIEILRERIYPLDAESHDQMRSEVVVEPGMYELLSDGMTTLWMMRGRLNQRGIWRMGDGMFAMHPSDSSSGIEVVFPSRRFGPDEWADLLSSPEFTEGSESQRIRVSLDTAVQS